MTYYEAQRPVVRDFESRGRRPRQSRPLQRMDRQGKFQTENAVVAFTEPQMPQVRGVIRVGRSCPTGVAMCHGLRLGAFFGTREKPQIVVVLGIPGLRGGRRGSCWRLLVQGLSLEGTIMYGPAMRGLRLCALLGLLGLTVSACSGSSSDSALASPTTTPTLVTENFSGSIDQYGTAIHPFSVKVSGGSLAAGFTSVGPLATMALGMGIGTWDGTTCGLAVSQNDNARAGFVALSGTAQAGNYCIRVYDSGNVAAGGSATYALQVTHY